MYRWLSTALLFFPITAAAQGQIGITDIMGMKVITDLQASMVGQSMVVSIQTYNGKDKFVKDLWLVSPGTAPRQLTFGGAGPFAISPEGKEVAFWAERSGKQGIYLLPLDGGEARLVAELPVQADNLIWQAGRIFFTANVFKDCKADLDCTRKRLEDKAKGPSASVYTELYFRPWNSWRDGTYQNLFALDPVSGKVEAVAVGEFDVPPIPFGGREDIAVSRDGVVVYAAKKVKDLALSTNTDLFEVASGTERRLTDNEAADQAPSFSPDGRFVAYLAQAVPGFESDIWRLKVFDRKTGTTVTLADGQDNWVHEFVWAPDGKAIYLTIEEQGYLLLYRAALKPDKPPLKRLSGRHTDRHLAVSGDGKFLYYTRESLLAPPDIYALDLKTLQETRVTNLNALAIARMKMPTVEEVWYDGAKVQDGKQQRVHAFLMRPPDAGPDKKYPLVVMIHGGPQGAWLNAFHSRWNPLPIASAGFVVVMPNPTGSTGYGQPFVNAISKDWGGKCYQDIMALLDFASTLPGVDASRACAMGGSFGGYMTNWIEGHTDRFKCLISHAGPSSLEAKYGTTDELWFPEWDIGGTPWDNPDAYARWSPHKFAKNFKTPMLVIHGANDFRVPLEQALVMFTYLRRQNVEAKLVVFPDEDHFVSKPLNRKFWYETVVDWLTKHLNN